MNIKRWTISTMLSLAMSFPALAEGTDTQQPKQDKPKGEHGRPMMDALGLNEEQAQQLRTVMEEAKQARESMKSEFEALRTKQQQLKKEHEALMAKAEQKRDEIMSKAKAFLNAEQYQKLQEFVKRMQERRPHPGEGKDGKMQRPEDGKGKKQKQQCGDKEKGNDNKEKGGDADLK